MLQFICKFSGIITLLEDNGMKQQLAEEYCRFVNETFEFIDKNFENVIPAGRLDQRYIQKSRPSYGRGKTGRIRSFS